jgi:hypothetical protein
MEKKKKKNESPNTQNQTQKFSKFSKPTKHTTPHTNTLTKRDREEYINITREKPE